MDIKSCKCLYSRTFMRNRQNPGYQVECLACGRSGPYMPMRDMAIAAWNEDKNEATALREMVDALADSLRERIAKVEGLERWEARDNHCDCGGVDMEPHALGDYIRRRAAVFFALKGA